ncbi:MAG: hypothetical protein QE487_05220 [Fluviicola sp.]|nr:hypothetical protein [Fluviicola sp.]
MKNILYLLGIILLVQIVVTIPSCQKDDPDISPIGQSEVTVDLSTVPYPVLSDYKFFRGEMKYQIPSSDVIAYAPATPLFTDYALKKRFIWMPDGEKASYVADNKVLEMPVGTVLIKTFYYKNVLPNGATKIIETRLLIRKASGWIFANYKWNDEQTEAYLTTSASTVPISWLQDGEQKSTNYRIPSETECLICHKHQGQPVPIGIKPQNLNNLFKYTEGSRNQLSKLIQAGYLEPGLPANITSTINYKDQSKSVDLRLRSYLDANCAHCHAEGGHCDYRPMRLAFSETVDPVNIGLCVEPDEFVGAAYTSIITPSQPDRSVMHLRLSTNQPNLRMPLIGRTIVHEEGLELLEEWIYSKKDCH